MSSLPSSATIRFHHPSTMIISGPTGCGKTQFVCRLLENNMLIDENGKAPNRIVWLYGAWQPLFEQLEAKYGDLIEFREGFDKEVIGSFDASVRNLVIIDDLMQQAKNDGIIANLFTKGSHHSNLTVMYLMQNLFEQGKYSVKVSRNSHYIVLFKNPRNSQEVRTLGQQMVPGRVASLVSIFESATENEFSYLVIDLRPQTPTEFRYRTQIFPGEITRLFEIVGVGRKGKATGKSTYERD